MLIYQQNKVAKFSQRLVFAGLEQPTSPESKQAKVDSQSKTPDAAKLNTDAAQLMVELKAKIETATKNNSTDLWNLNNLMTSLEAAGPHVSQELARELQAKLHPEVISDHFNADTTPFTAAQSDLNRRMYGTPETPAEELDANLTAARAQDKAKARRSMQAELNAHGKAHDAALAAHKAPTTSAHDGGSFSKLTAALEATARNAETPSDPISEAVKKSPGRFRPEAPQDTRIAQTLPPGNRPN